MIVLKQFKSKIFISIVLVFISNIFTSASFANTSRVYQIENDKVKVWKTVIYPTEKKRLALHRHDHDRVVIALTDGVLKVTNDKGQVHYLKLKKGMSYFLTKDPKNEMHVDENITHKVVSVVVIELK